MHDLVLKFILVCSFCFVSFGAFTEQPGSNSEDYAGNNETQFTAWEEKAFQLKETEPDSALFYAKRAIQYVVSEQADINIAGLYNLAGKIYVGKGQYINANNNFRNALEKAEEYRDNLEAGNASRNLASMLISLGDPNKARRSLRNAVEYYKELSDPSFLAKAYEVYAEYYKYKNDLDSALLLSKRAESIYLALEDTGDVYRSYHDIFDIYHVLGDSEKVEEYLTRLKNHLSGEENSFKFFEIHLKFAEYYYSEQLFNQAKAELNIIKPHIGAGFAEFFESKFYVLEGKLHLRDQDTTRAVNSFRLAAEGIENKSTLSAIGEASSELATLLDVLGQPAEAEKYRLRAVSIKENIKNDELSLRLEKLNLTLNLSKLQEENQRLLLEAENTNSNLVLISIAMLTLLVGLVVFYINRWNKIKIEKKHLKKEKALRRILELNEKRYKELLNNSLVSICVHDFQGVVMSINEAGAQSLGYSVEELKGHNLDEFIPERHIKGFHKYLQTINEKGTISGIWKMIHKNGEERFFMYQNKVVNEEGSYSYVLASQQDVTDWKKAEKAEAESRYKIENLVGQLSREVDARKASEERLSTIINLIPFMVFLGDHEGRFVLVNDTFAEKVNKPYNQIIGKTFSEATGKDTKMEQYYKEVSDSKSMKVIPEEHFEDFYGVEHVLNIILTPFGFSNNEVPLILGVAIDITQHKQYEKDILAAKNEAERANQAKSEFLANMSHEIRTPLNSILGFSEILLKNETNPVSIEYLNTILSSGKTLLSLINDLLDMAKIESGMIELLPGKIYLKSTFNELIDMFQSASAKKSIYLRVNIDNDLPAISLLDEIRLKQILINLIGNAVKFTTKGGVSINVKAQSVNHDAKKYTLVIEVIDTGIGIAANQVDNVFQAFNQGNKGAMYLGGTGLGLTITKRLINLMKGDIKLESKEGEGSKFTVTIPVSWFEQKEHEVQKEKKEEAPEFQHSKILVVDDVKYNRLLIKAMLKGTNIEIFMADGGNQCIEVLKNNQIDLILMDLQMPEMDGHLVVEKIKDEVDPDFTNFVAFTASLTSGKEFMDKGYFLDVLLKPAMQEDLFVILKKYLPIKNDVKEIDQNVGVVEMEGTNLDMEEFSEIFYEKVKALSKAVEISELELLMKDLNGYLYGQSGKLVDVVKELEKAYHDFDVSSISAYLIKLTSMMRKKKK